MYTVIWFLVLLSNTNDIYYFKLLFLFNSFKKLFLFIIDNHVFEHRFILVLHSLAANTRVIPLLIFGPICLAGYTIGWFIYPRSILIQTADQYRSEPLQLPGSASAGRVICGTDLAECVSVPGDFLRPQGAFPQAFTSFGRVGLIARRLSRP